jgi:hypothetical protein
MYCQAVVHLHDREHVDEGKDEQPGDDRGSEDLD